MTTETPETPETIDPPPARMANALWLLMGTPPPPVEEVATPPAGTPEARADVERPILGGTSTELNA